MTGDATKITENKSITLFNTRRNCSTRLPR